MKYCTDKEQTEALIKIGIPADSADMYCTEEGGVANFYICSSDGECHCSRGWSLQALINMLPDVIWTENKFGKWFYSYNIQKDQVDYGCITEGGSWSVMISSPQGELVDAIVSMLLYLSEHKLYDFSNYGKDETKTAD